MNDESSPADPQQAAPSDSPTEKPQPPALRVGTVLVIVTPIALVVLGGFVVFGVLDGATWLSDAMKPKRVTVTGTVIYNGEPLPAAQISTRHVNSKLAGAIGWGDEQGNFTLKTHVRGDFLDGAYEGEHQVAIKRYDPNVASIGEPPLVTPRRYASFETSPLRIVVKDGQAALEIKMEGEPENRPVPPGSRREMPSMRPPGAPRAADADEPSEK